MPTAHGQMPNDKKTPPKNGRVDIWESRRFAGGFSAFTKTPVTTQPAAITAVSQTAGGSYTATEQAMLAALKLAVNTIITTLQNYGMTA